MTTDDVVLRDTLGEYLAATVPGIVEEVAGLDRDEFTLAYTSLGLGVQFGLEVSQLDPTVARALISAIHESPFADPEATTEHNSQALIFLQLVARRCAG